MYNSIVHQNPILSQFQNYSVQQQSTVPFRGNELINNNVHVSNNLNSLIQQQKMQQNNMQQYQAQIYNAGNTQTQDDSNDRRKNKKTNISNKAKNIIEDMLKPQKIVKDNKDVKNNFKDRENEQELIKKGKKKFDITNAPYKVIIKDKIVTKKVEDVKKEDILVHKSIREIDADRKRFDTELSTKHIEKEKINDELKIEFNVDNYDTHKKSFEFKQTFIRNMAYEEKTFDQNKEDYIEFYRRKQKEEEDGKKLCDEILLNLVDEGIISKDELPTSDKGDDNTPNTKIAESVTQTVSDTTNNQPQQVRRIIKKVVVQDVNTNQASSVQTSSEQPKKKIIRKKVDSVVVV